MRLEKVIWEKGKTNADFTAMLLHCALAASPFALSSETLTVLDPMCGKGTTLFTALVEGMNAVGIDMDRKALEEADTYLTRSLQIHRVSHSRTQSSRTLRGGGTAPEATFALKTEKPLSCRFLFGDASRTDEMLKPGSVHLIVSDLPYGVQHAPGKDGRMSTLERLAGDVSRACKTAARKGAVLGFSFNENTLRRETLERALEQAGWQVLRQEPYHDLRHWVEQAIERDAVFAVNP